MKSDWKKNLLYVSLFLFFLNLLILDAHIFTKKTKESLINPLPKPQPSTEKGFSPKTNQSSLEAKPEINFCPAACLEIISQATSSSLSTEAIPTSTPINIEPNVKEFYIPLGSGSTTSSNWEALPGIESVVDTTNYPKIKSVIFEASMRVPTANGRVYAKLYNVTDKHDVWNSEVYVGSADGRRVESGKIVLSSGKKLYRVMLKSTMGYPAFLDLARIKILLE